MVAYFIEEDERSFVLILLLVSMAARTTLILLFSYYELSTSVSEDVLGIGDQEFITLWGRLYAEYASGESQPLVHGSSIGYMMHRDYYGYSINMKLLGILYYLFGYSPIASKVFNAMLASTTGVVFYAIARQYFGRLVARFTFFLVLLWPSLVMWSITNLKEALRIFLVGVIMLLYTRVCRNFRVARVVVIGGLLVLLTHTLRTGLVAVLAAALLLASFFELGMRLKVKVAILLGLALLLLFVGPLRQATTQRLGGEVKNLINYHRGVVSTGGQIYHLYDDPRYYTSDLGALDVSAFEVLKAFARAWWHFLLEPFVWNAESLREKAVMPQNLFWYLLLPLAGLGLMCVVRIGAAGAWGFPLVLFSFISVIALASGNVGTAFRHRDMITPFVLLFGAAGITRLLCGLGRDEDSAG